MKEVIAEAQAAGVDGDLMQALAGKGDWDGLTIQSANCRARRQAEIEAASVEAAIDLPPKEALASLVKTLRENNTILRKVIEV